MRFSSLTLALAGHLTLALAGSSFGGVNHYYLANLPTAQRDSVITKLHEGGAKVIRTLLEDRPYSQEKGNSITASPDVESSLGVFDLSVLDRYDDLLAAVYKISGGSMKVILSLHNANLLGKDSSDDLCDAYCHYLHDNGIKWHDFYTNDEMRKRLKERYRQILTNYKSPNFGKTWNRLSNVILAIDLENEPMVGDSNMEYDFGDWICDMATHLKDTCGLSGIAVSTGGTRGADWGDTPPATVGQNWPSDVFECEAVDIIAFHGYYSDEGQAWLNLFSGENLDGVLRPKALKNNKLLMVEEWSYTRGKDDNFTNQKADIKAQGQALNLRGIPWLYWDVRTGDDGYCDSDGCKEVSVDGSGPWPVLSSVMKQAFNSATEFDWSKYFPTNPDAETPDVDIPDTTTPDDTCTWGCLGWDCSASVPCSESRECVWGICKVGVSSRSPDSADCTWGCEGWDCSSKSPCADGRQCVKGICHEESTSDESSNGDSSDDSSSGDSCTWGCEGWDCDSDSPCADDRQCVKGICHSETTKSDDKSDDTPDSKDSSDDNSNDSDDESSDCTWGCEGWDCSSKSPCADGRQCVKGICHAGHNSAFVSSTAVSRTSAAPETTTHAATLTSTTASSPMASTSPKCTWGCEGWDCSTKSPCAEGRECVKGICKAGLTSSSSTSLSLSLSTSSSTSSSVVSSTTTSSSSLSTTTTTKIPSLPTPTPASTTGGNSSSTTPSCTWGCEGWDCSSQSPCSEGRECVRGICHDEDSSPDTITSNGNRLHLGLLGLVAMIMAFL